jgi:hypothetical protein
MTITNTTSITTIPNAIKPSVNNMSNIMKSVMNIQHTRHTRSANTTILTMNDKHPLIIAFYYKYNKFFLNIQIFL